MNELRRFVTGNGVYTDDINRANQHYMVVVRSTKAHADFEIRNIDALKKHKDVACVVDHRMMFDSDFKPFITASKRSSKPWGNALAHRLINAFADFCHWLHVEHFLNQIRFLMQKGNMPHMDIIPEKTVHYVGQPLCAIVAHSLDCALKVAAKVDVVYQEHPAVTNLNEAKTNNKRVHSQFEDNVVFDVSTLHKEQVEKALFSHL